MLKLTFRDLQWYQKVPLLYDNERHLWSRTLMSSVCVSIFLRSRTKFYVLCPRELLCTVSASSMCYPWFCVKENFCVFFTLWPSALLLCLLSWFCGSMCSVPRGSVGFQFYVRFQCQGPLKNSALGLTWSKREKERKRVREGEWGRERQREREKERQW